MCAFLSLPLSLLVEEYGFEAFGAEGRSERTAAWRRVSVRSDAQPVNPYRKRGGVGGIIIKPLPHAPQAKPHMLRDILLLGFGNDV